MSALGCFAALGCVRAPSWGAAHVVEYSTGRLVEITASRRGFTPDHIIARVGERVRLRFERSTASSCAKEVVVRLDAERTIRRELPVGVAVEVELVMTRAGELGFACGMSMHGGTIEVRP